MNKFDDLYKKLLDEAKTLPTPTASDLTKDATALKAQKDTAELSSEKQLLQAKIDLDNLKRQILPKTDLITKLEQKILQLQQRVEHERKTTQTQTKTQTQSPPTAVGAV